jgi:hypothetical protein
MFLKRIREGGVTACRRFTAGMMGESEILDEFTWLDGHLFPPTNSKVRREHMTNRAAVKAIDRARASFSLPGVDDVQSIRTRSLRHHSIQTLKSNGVALDAGMAHARLRSPTVYLGYGARTDHELRPEYLHKDLFSFKVSVRTARLPAQRKQRALMKIACVIRAARALMGL